MNRTTLISMIVIFTLTTYIYSMDIKNQENVIEKNLDEDQEIITEIEYKKLVNGKYTDLLDIIKLFPKNVSDVKKRVDLTLQEARKNLDLIIQLKTEKRTFKNTMQAYDTAQEKFNIIRNSLNCIEKVHRKKNIREACHNAVSQLNDFYIAEFSKSEIYNALKAYHDTNSKNEILNQEEDYFLHETMDDFKRLGLGLSPKKYEKISKLRKKLAQLSLDFLTNINSNEHALYLDEDELNGIEKNFIDTLEKNTEGKYIVKCTRPAVDEIVPHCNIRSTRQAMIEAYYNRAYPINKKIIKKIIKKRDKLAQLLDFPSYAHYDIANQMAGSLEVAEKFIQDLAKKVEEKENAEFEHLISDLPDNIKINNGRFDLCDFGYTQEYHRKKYFDLDDHQIAQYFPLEKTIKGIFDIYQTFLNLEFKLKKLEGLGNDEIFVLEITYPGNKSPDGYIFLDLHSHHALACCAGIVSPLKSSDGLHKGPSVSIIIANFPKPTKECPTLLKHKNVLTFFHEFGHAMHDFLGRTQMSRFAGKKTKRDFVEVVSQMFEEWMWDKKVLKKISSHYKTGEPLPTHLINKLIEVKRFNYGHLIQFQCYYALLAFEHFKSGSQKNLSEIMPILYEKINKHLWFPQGTHRYTSFVHMTVERYGAKVYTYMWSKAFALDLFHTICNRYKDKDNKKDDNYSPLFDKNIGKELVEKVLSKGGSVDPYILLTDFLGHEPSQDAFLKDMGINV